MFCRSAPPLQPLFFCIHDGFFPIVDPIISAFELPLVLLPFLEQLLMNQTLPFF
jgi:hypothetical protein